RPKEVGSKEKGHVTLTLKKTTKPKSQTPEPKKEEVSKGKDESLDGEWKVTGAEGDTARTEKALGVPLKPGGVVACKDRIISLKWSKYHLKIVEIDAGKAVKEVTFVEVDEHGKPVEPERRLLGVYKIDGDVLTITLAPVNSKQRPAAVGAHEQGNLSVT